MRPVSPRVPADHLHGHGGNIASDRFQGPSAADERRFMERVCHQIEIPAASLSVSRLALFLRSDVSSARFPPLRRGSLNVGNSGKASVHVPTYARTLVTEDRQYRGWDLWSMTETYNAPCIQGLHGSLDRGDLVPLTFDRPDLLSAR